MACGVVWCGVVWRWRVWLYDLIVDLRVGLTITSPPFPPLLPYMLVWCGVAWCGGGVYGCTI